MSIIYNGTELQNIKFSNTDITKVIYNQTVVFEKDEGERFLVYNGGKELIRDDTEINLSSEVPDGARIEIKGSIRYTIFPSGGGTMQTFTNYGKQGAYTVPNPVTGEPEVMEFSLEISGTSAVFHATVLRFGAESGFPYPMVYTFYITEIYYII